MLKQLLPCVEVDSEKKARGSVIWLHGLGADGYDFEPIVLSLGLPDVRFVFPHAPIRAITLNFGEEMRAWYDIIDLSFSSKEDVRGIAESQMMVEALIENEIAKGIPSEKIVIAGFSQGGAIALQTALRYSKLLGGVLALSTYLPLAESLSTEKKSANQSVPIFMAHGTIDPIVPYELAKRSRDCLLAQGYAVDFHSYPMAHCTCQEEVKDMAQWLKNIF